MFLQEYSSGIAPLVGRYRSCERMYIMPVDFLTAEQRQRYGRYPDDLTMDQQSRCFYLDDADQFLIQQCRTDATRLGFALQLCTVRFLGTFLDDPTDVPPVLVTLVAHQLGITDAQEHLASYRLNPVRWKHTAEIRHLSGYAVFTDQPGHDPTTLSPAATVIYIKIELFCDIYTKRQRHCPLVHGSQCSAVNLQAKWH